MKPVSMNRHEVLAIHYSSAPKPPPVGESPVAEGKSLVATQSINPIEEEIEFVKPTGKKKRSVRELVSSGIYD